MAGPAPNDMCFWHGYEPLRDGDYLVCGECWHVWRTQADFVRDVRAIDGTDWLVADSLLTPETVHACPLCCHDF